MTLVSWQYGIPSLLALVCLGLTAWGLAIWSAWTKRRRRARSQDAGSTRR